MNTIDVKWAKGLRAMLDSEKAARAKAAAICEAEQRVLAIVEALPRRAWKTPVSLDKLFDALGKLKALGWEPKL